MLLLIKSKKEIHDFHLSDFIRLTEKNDLKDLRMTERKECG